MISDALNLLRVQYSSTFEYEKGLNIEEVEQMKAMEKNLIGMAREVERLRDEVSNAEKRAHGNFLSVYRFGTLDGFCSDASDI